MLGYKPTITSMNLVNKTAMEKNQQFTDKERYEQLVEKLISLYHTRPYISFAILMSQLKNILMLYIVTQIPEKNLGQRLFFKKSNDRDLSVFMDVDWAGSLTDRRSTNGFVLLFGII